MPVRKIPDPTKFASCQNPEHSPVDTMHGLEPGLYEHECPGCQRKVVFRVPEPYKYLDEYLTSHET
jgi:hypothetical protein